MGEIYRDGLLLTVSLAPDSVDRTGDAPDHAIVLIRIGLARVERHLVGLDLCVRPTEPGDMPVGEEQMSAASVTGREAFPVALGLADVVIQPLRVDLAAVDARVLRRISLHAAILVFAAVRHL